MAKLRKMLTHPGKNESGQGALAMVLLLLMLGAIILTPLLVFMQTGVKAGRVYESKMQEFYAADAGVEDAIWEINNGNSGEAYFLPEEPNGRNVSVNVTQIKKGTYKINSTATSDSGGNTTIECYYGALDYSSLLDNAITSDTGVTIKKGVNVTGNISTPDCSVVCDSSAGCPSCPNWTCCVDCLNCTTCCSEEPLDWPTAEELSAWYWDDVENLDLFPDAIIDIDGSDALIEPLYRDGILDIYNGDNTPATATLNGTVYVTGDTTIGKAPKNFTLNLNNHTIFIESASADPQKAIWVGGNVQIIGSGCIIAVGDVYFEPKGDVGSNTTFVLIMSIEGTVTLRPSGNFYGAIAGKDTVMEQSGKNPSITWTSYEGEGIDFPIGQSMMKVLSYTIK